MIAMKRQPEIVYSLCGHCIGSPCKPKKREGRQHRVRCAAAVLSMPSSSSSSSSSKKQKELLEAFKVFDTSGDGALDVGELKAIFQRPGGGHALSDEQVQELFDEFDVNGDGVLEFAEFSSFWSDSFGDAGDDLLRESVTSSKTQAASSGSGSGKTKVPKAKDIKLQPAAELDAKLLAEQEMAKKLEDSATDAVSLSFERRLGAALIRNDKGNELKAGKLDKYLSTLIRKWDSNGDGVISMGEFRLAVRGKPLNVKAESKEIDELFSKFDKDGSGDLELKEMKPFLKTLQAAAYAAEEEANSNLALAAVMRDQADMLAEASKTMRHLDRLQLQRKDALATTSVAVHVVNALNSGPAGKRVKIEEAPVKIWGCTLPPKPPEVTRAQFATGVMKALAGAKDDVLVSLGDSLPEKIDMWFTASVVSKGGDQAASAKATVDMSVVLQQAKAEAAEHVKLDEQRTKEIAAVEKKAREQQRTIAMEEQERREREEEARSAANASRAAELAAASFHNRGFENAEEMAGTAKVKVNKSK